MTWDVDGLGNVTKTFAADDFASIVVSLPESGQQKFIFTLTQAAADELAGLEGFGGTSSTDATDDTLDIAIGLLTDTAGNLSTGLATVANAELA